MKKQTYSLEQLVAIVRRCEDKRIDERCARLDLGDVLAELVSLGASYDAPPSTASLLAELRNESTNSDHCGAAQHLFGQAADEIVRLGALLEAAKSPLLRDLVLLVPSAGVGVNKPSHRYPRTMVAHASSQRPTGKQHCGGPSCEKDPYTDDACDCTCGTRCGPYNDWLRAQRSCCGDPPPAPRDPHPEWGPLPVCPACNGRRGHYEPAVAHTDVWHTCDLCKGNGIVIEGPPAPPASGTSGCGFCQHIAPGPHETCVVCGRNDHAGLGCWAVHFDDPNDNTPVCKGKCWQAYQSKKKAEVAERDLLEALARWGST